VFILYAIKLINITVKSIFSIITLIWGLILLLNVSCNSNVINTEKRLSINIANESCSFISEISSSIAVELLSGAINTLTEDKFVLNSDANTNLVPGYWCECYTYYISNELAVQFTIDELREIKNDNVKKIMVLSKLLQINIEEIKNCIQLTMQDKVKNYTDFERKLNRKLKTKSYK